MNLLITGGAGFIGSHLSDRLISEGCSVTALDDLSTGSLDNLAGLLPNSRYEFVEGNVLNEGLVRQLVSRCDRVVHLAAAVGVRRILEDPLSCLRTNVDGSAVILKASAEFGRSVLLASTSEVYGKNDSESLCEESDSILGPASIERWSYATAKKLDEFLGLAYHSTHGIPVTITRFFNIVGPRQFAQYGMVLPGFVRAALKNQPIRVFGDGSQTRNFTYIDDCVEALMRLLRHREAAGKIFNIGASEEVSIRELAERVKLASGSQSPVVTIPYEEAYPEGSFEDMRRRVPCICRIQALTGWAPTTSLNTVIQETIQFEKSRLAVEHPLTARLGESHIETEGVWALA